jgi:hypothetical protein
MTQSWFFWFLICFFGGAALAFTALASAIRFDIASAMIALVLIFVLMTTGSGMMIL